MEPEQKNVKINVDAETAKGIYSNLALITHSDQEFVLDFAQNLPGMSGPSVASRIIFTPDHAKRLLAALEDNIAKYEQRFGPIGKKGTFVVPQGGASA